MAILDRDSAEGLTAEILINGSPALEYDDPDEVQIENLDQAIRDYQVKRTVSKYIEAQTGQKFGIMVRVGKPLGHEKMMHPKLLMDIEVDGIKIWTMVCDRPWFRKHDDGAEWHDVLLGPKEGKGRNCTVREFSFVKIETSCGPADKRHVARQAQRMQKKGCIVIKVYNANAGRSGGPQTEALKGFLKREGETVPEKAVKGDAKSHGATLGKAKKTPRGPVFRCEKKDGEDYPIAIFRFNYRDFDSLKQMHVIPRTPVPTPTPSPSLSPEPEDATGGLTEEQQQAIAEIKQRFAADNQEARAKAKDVDACGESKKDKAKKTKRIKREHVEWAGVNGRAAKRAKKANGERIEINLVSDDEGEIAAGCSKAGEGAGPGADADVDAGREDSEDSGDDPGLFQS